MIGGVLAAWSPPINTSDASPNHKSEPLNTAEVIVLNVDDSTKHETVAGAGAFQIMLSPCVQTYGNISFTNAVFREHLLSTKMIPYVESNGHGYYSLAGDFSSASVPDCSSSAQPVGTKTQPTTLVKGRSELRYAAHFGHNASDPHLRYYDPACVFDFGYGPAMQLSGILHRQIYGNSSSPSSSYPKTVISNTNVNLTDVYTGDPWLISMWRNGTADLDSMTRYADGLAASLTGAIRSLTDQGNSRPALGTVFANQTCIGVDWAWLALPIALMFFAVLFTVSTALQTWRHTKAGAPVDGKRPWKSSSLALLWCGIDDSTRYRAGCFDGVPAMEDRSDEVKVRLRRVVRWTENGGMGEEKPGSGSWVLKEDED
jgi:hypothetical protein